jgi:predicted membrane chloride channel (bestrophin family)
MIIYDHVPVLLRLIQYKGTVLEDTAPHLILVNLVVVLVLLFSEGGWLAGSSRPEWMPAPVFSTQGPVSPIAWQMLILPLGFLLGVRSNQAYERWSNGVESYTQCISAASELCRQASSYVKMDVEGGSGEGPNWQYRNAPSGVWPESGQNDYEDPDKERLFRHSLAFLAMVRQDIRKRRIVDNEDREAVIRRATEDRLHVTEQELQHLVDTGVYSPEVNGPLVIARWLSHDVAALAHRISLPTLVAAMETNIGKMVGAFQQIDKISDHPVPWPYTHLTQVFLIFWVYTLPLAMVRCPIVYARHLGAASCVASRGPLLTNVLCRRRSTKEGRSSS